MDAQRHFGAVVKRCFQYLIGIGTVMAITTLFWLSGCAPSGPEALMRGEKLLQDGKYELAMGKLEIAVSSMPTNAQAWNLLGVAYHGVKEIGKAQAAYEQALAIDRNLLSVRYNLGCLFLETQVLPAAISNLTIFTTMQPTSAEGWGKLGDAYSQVQQFQASSICYSNVLKLNPQNFEIWNSLGMLSIQRGKPRDSISCFSNALYFRTNYAPAVLNLAILYHQHLHNRPLAMQKYQEYLALQPQSDQTTEIEKIIRQLKEELNPPAKNVVTNALAVNISTNLPQTNQIVATNQALLTANQLTNKADISPGKTNRLAQNETSSNGGSKSNSVAIVKKENKLTNPPVIVRKVDPPKETKTNVVTEQKPVSETVKSNQTVVAAKTLTPETKKSEINNQTAPNRYPYRSPAVPATGNREEAERLLAEASRERQEGHWQTAVSLYQKAAVTDPSSFEARFNLGLAGLYAGQIPQALIELEYALAIIPDSYQARFNFALALEKAHYVRDAIQQLEILQKQFPQDTRIPLQMGKWYAEGLGQNHLARKCYLRVLELDPQHPQAVTIRYWLAAHP